MSVQASGRSDVHEGEHVELHEGEPLTLTRRRDPVRWLAALRAGVERVKPGARERVQRTLEHARRRGAVTGARPYGWRSTRGGWLVEHAAERAVLERMIALRRAGSTCAEIADALNRTSSTRSGRPWRRSTVHARLVVAGAWLRGPRP